MKDEAHGRGHFHPELAGAHDETGVGVADAGGELAEGAGSTRVAVGAEQDFARTGVTFLGKGNVANAFVLVGANVVVVLDVLLSHELPQHIDVAVGHLVGREDVVVGDDDYFFFIPHPGLSAEMLLEDADGPGAADIVRHEDVHVDPDVVSRLNLVAPGMAGEDFLRQRHRRHEDSRNSDFDSTRIIASLAMSCRQEWSARACLGAQRRQRFAGATGVKSRTLL